MNKLLLALALFFSVDAQATSLQDFEKEHKKMKQQLFASLDYCSNIGNKEIFNFGTKSLEEINTYRTKVKNKFKKIKEQKTNCFDNSKDYLNDIIAENFIFIQESDENELFDQQNKIDQRLSDTISLRKNINIQLIDSILLDSKNSIKKTPKEKMSSSFITESKKTKKLISQELNVIYDSMDDQLKLDQSSIDSEEYKTIKVTEVANVSLRFAFLSLSRALLLFENIEEDRQAYNLAKISTHVSAASNKLKELKAFSDKLEDLDSKKDINKVINQLAILTVDLDVTIKEILEDEFKGDFLNWAGKIYQETSDTVTKIQEILDTIYLIDITKEAMPIDITIKEESLEFSPIQAIQPLDELTPMPKKTKKAKASSIKKDSNNA